MHCGNRSVRTLVYSLFQRSRAAQNVASERIQTQHLLHARQAQYLKAMAPLECWSRQWIIMNHKFFFMNYTIEVTLDIDVDIHHFCITVLWSSNCSTACSWQCPLDSHELSSHGCEYPTIVCINLNIYKIYNDMQKSRYKYSFLWLLSLYILDLLLAVMKPTSWIGGKRTRNTVCRCFKVLISLTIDNNIKET